MAGAGMGVLGLSKDKQIFLRSDGRGFLGNAFFSSRMRASLPSPSTFLAAFRSAVSHFFISARRIWAARIRNQASHLALSAAQHLFAMPASTSCIPPNTSHQKVTDLFERRAAILSMMGPEQTAGQMNSVGVVIQPRPVAPVSK